MSFQICTSLLKVGLATVHQEGIRECAMLIQSISLPFVSGFDVTVVAVTPCSAIGCSSSGW